MTSACRQALQTDHVQQRTAVEHPRLLPTVASPKSFRRTGRLTGTLHLGQGRYMHARRLCSCPHVNSAVRDTASGLSDRFETTPVQFLGRPAAWCVCMILERHVIASHHTAEHAELCHVCSRAQLTWFKLHCVPRIPGVGVGCWVLVLVLGGGGVQQLQHCKIKKKPVIYESSAQKTKMGGDPPGRCSPQSDFHIDSGKEYKNNDTSFGFFVSSA